jgi:hypothetical protein
MGMHRVLDVAWVMADSDPESHAADHHDEGNYLDRSLLSSRRKCSFNKESIQRADE